MPKGKGSKAKTRGRESTAKASAVPRPGAASGAPAAQTGPADPAHAAAARKAAFGAFNMGFGVGSLNGLGQINTSAYTSSYANMGVGGGMLNDVPQYFQVMNENNGGMLYWPVTLKEKYSWFRYFARCFADAAVPVMIAGGYTRPMNELQPGDMVINAQGEAIAVKERVSYEYDGLLYSIRAEGISPLEVTGDHLFQVVEKESVSRHFPRRRDASGREYRLHEINVDFKPVWKPASLLSEGDSLVTISPKKQDLADACAKAKVYYVPIRGITTRPFCGLVHSLELDAEDYDARSYVAGGIVSHNCDPFVYRAVQFHTDLPMSRLILRMPKMEDEALRQKILRKYEGMVKRLKLFDRLHSVLYELNVLGNAAVFADYDEERKEWGRLVILPPEEIVISRYPMSDTARVQYRPELLSGLLRNYNIPVDSEENYAAFVAGLEPGERGAFADVSYEVAKALVEHDGVLDLDTDPFSGEDGCKIGSFVHHFSLQRHEYFDLGTSPLECVLIPLLMKEHYKYTQLSLASRNMTPRSKITAPDIGEEALANLREQVDMSMLNPDYSIVTNYDWNWELIGAENRLIDLSREYEVIENQLFAGLGVTREILTGEGMYSGSKISVELLNTRYLFLRDMLSHYVEESLFLPIAEENGFYETDEWGNKNYFYPRLSFTRLSIRDNSEVFDSLFQLYQKGSLPIDVILELFNLDADEVHEKLKQDMFTVKDSTYNDMVRSVYNDLGSKVVEETDLADRVIAYMTGPDGKPLKKKSADGEEGGDDYDDDSQGDDVPVGGDGYGDAPTEPSEMPSSGEADGNGGNAPSGPDAPENGENGGSDDFLDQLIEEAKQEEARQPQAASAPEAAAKDAATGEIVAELLEGEA